MTSSKTHDATPRRLDDARRAGDLPHSRDLACAASLAACVVALGLLGPRIAQACEALWSVALAAARAGSALPTEAAWSAVQAGGSAAFLVLLAIACGALLGSLLQTGFAWSQIHGRERPSLRAQAFPFATAEHGREHAWLAVKVLVLACALGAALAPSLPGLLDLAESAPAWAGVASAKLARFMLLRAAAVLSFVGFADLVYRRLRHKQRLRMTRRELDDERRATEGDPQLRSERQRRARALADEATLAELARATLVLHDASGLAVALCFEPGKHPAPVVWSKGRGASATRMLEHANHLGVPVHCEPELVTRLVRLEITEPVPAESYARVAQLMAAGAR